MLPRQARRNLSLRRNPTFTSLWSSPRSSLVFSSTPTQERRTVITSHSRPWRRRASIGDRRERTLATAVGDLYMDHQFGTPIPPFQTHPSRSHILPPFDPSSLVVIPEPSSGPRAPTKINSFGIVGEAEDLLSVFDACLRVGKLDRATLVLKRLNVSPSLSDEERIVLNNSYLRASLSQMRTSPDRKQAEMLHKWYELQIRSKGLPHTAETIACMLKASLLSERGARLNRLVKRYMGMAPGEAGLRVLSMADVLSDSDLAIITEICPTYNFTAEPDEMDAMFDEDIEVPSAKNRPFPQLTPTPQQGEGLNTLIKSLEFMAGLQDVDVSKLSPADQMEVQLQLERDSIDAALMKWRHEHDKMRKMGINTELGITSSEEGSLSQHTASWLHALEKRLQEEFRLIEMSESKEKKSEVDLERCVYGPLIQQSDPARLAAITILSTLNLGAMYGVDKGIMVAKLVNQIAKHAQEDIQAQQRERREKARRRERKVQMKAGKEVQANAASEETTVLLDSQREQELLNESSRQPWSVAIKAQVGAILLKALMKTAKMKVTINHPQTGEPVSQFQPTFTHIQQVRKGKKTGVLLINPKLVERLMKEPMGDYLAKHLPMIVEPKPWRKFNEGGFLEGKTSLVRVKPGDVEQRLYTNAALKSGDMGQLLKGLDVLGKTAWRINTDVLNVMMDAWNSGEETANMPALSPEFTMPQEPDPIENPGEHRFWKRAVKAIENERSGLHSQRCFMNLQLEIARAFRNQTIYFPHNVDYRGRAYPIPTYLNHMGADHTRGLLTFSKGKELGARGLRWLKIHLANVYGLDKASFDDREAFANEHVADIIDSATNPLNGQRWWLKAEEPWQCLATCFELRGALALEDPTKFVSHMPVQQDGTCNGLQHYAALGGDTWGAKQVNLEPGEKPADVYSAVAELVKAGIAKDAESKVPAALALDGKITRKVVKQTVMTNVYGVTFAGAKKQVCKQLDALYPDLGKEHDTNNIMLASYVAKHIFTALATMFRGAHDIQYWLGEVGGRVCRALTVAQLNQIAEGFEGKMPKAPKKGKSSSWTQAGVEEITKSFRSSVVWTTPLRMPVVQPYRKSTNKEIRTCFQSLVYPVSDQTDPVNRKKQLQGFPPNFIHSLDASHMLLSALQCHDLGLNFAAVHDSFWTHAADIDSMNSVLREAFIQIHEEDVIGRLATEFKARHNGSLYLAHIDSNTPVGKKIMELRKNSKLSPKEELLLEHKRNTLRLSGNPWDLEAAKQIVTPASVYEDMAANEEDLEIKEDVKEISLGLVPDQETTPSEHERMVDNVDSLVAAEDVADDVHEAASEDADTETTPVKAAPKKKSTLSLWLPLTIPTIPQKGDFDVTRLRESKYFFS